MKDNFINFMGAILHKIDVHDDHVNGAYDEDGGSVYCDLCGSEMYFKKGNWECRECGQKMDRDEFFNYIGAEPPGDECIDSCNENYPLCREECERYN